LFLKTSKKSFGMLLGLKKQGFVKLRAKIGIPARILPKTLHKKSLSY
jgi:hypothetical protein